MLPQETQEKNQTWFIFDGPCGSFRTSRNFAECGAVTASYCESNLTGGLGGVQGQIRNLFNMVFPVFFVFWTLLLPLLVESTPSSQELFPTDCSDVYANGQTLSGVYTIYPTADTPVQVYCDMGCRGSPTEDGNWMVFQRRMDGSVNFYRPWEQYKKGFGNKDGEYWLGLENLYQLTRKRKYELKVDLQDFDGASVYARYSSFSVDSEAEGYKLHVSGFINGGAGDSMATNNGQKFSTLDKDQDSYAEGNCAKSYFGGFWYSQCHNTNPNGIYLWGHDARYAIGNVWQHWKGYHYSLKYIAMKIRPVAQ
ncbi:microfibril-associated glycoprotein 4-like [Clarias magur]|uniref:Microfibril-associated glycoprotein 4-like n=1 Tax=Clarias magur TaxID=1594786 RepID=A0A8J4TEJ8_CLAMG|nr:microfibril-associated glycoprotein 4-like [Clarias magur]